MFGSIKKIFVKGQDSNLAELVKNGAQILDVRTRGEFEKGHIRGAINIPVDELPKQLSKLKKDRPVITCCASGMRSATARSFLHSNGFFDVHDGGGWYNLQHKIS